MSIDGTPTQQQEIKIVLAELKTRQRNGENYLNLVYKNGVLPTITSSSYNKSFNNDAIALNPFIIKMFVD